MTRNYGLIIEQPTQEDWILGSANLPVYATTTILQEDGQWDNFLPARELQKLFGVEPSACASFGTLNGVEVLEKRKYNIEHNWADRWLAWNSGTTPVGNSPHQVGEYLRKGGVPLQQDWPVTPDVNTFEKYYETPPANLVEKARGFLKLYDFKHYYVPGTVEAIKDALRFSPVGMSVSAWAERDGVYYQFGTDNHWVLCFGFDDEKRAWKIFDSYEDNIKLYSYDAKPAIVKGYYIGRGNKPWYCTYFPLWRGC